MRGLPLAQVETFSGARPLNQQAQRSQVGSRDHKIIREVGTDPAGTSNYGHDAAGRSFTKTMWKIKLFFLKLYTHISRITVHRNKNVLLLPCKFTDYVLFSANGLFYNSSVPQATWQPVFLLPMNLFLMFFLH